MMVVMFVVTAAPDDDDLAMGIRSFDGAHGITSDSAVEPVDSPLLTEGKAGPHKIQGLGANFVPAILDREVYDEVIDVSLEDSVATARELAAKEGIFAGISSGAVVHVAQRIASELDEGEIVCLLADGGWKYASAGLWDRPADELETAMETKLWW